jgi:hypothetical protein
MTANTTTPNRGPQSEPADQEPADQLATQDQAGAPESLRPPEQPDAPAKSTTPGRMPLFRR